MNFAFNISKCSRDWSFEKRKAVFGWLMKREADSCFLQETYTTKEVENIRKHQWKGDMFFFSWL